MPARTRRPKHNEKTREKIQASQIINRLTKHIFGEIEMQPSQVTAGLGLLKKVIPDLSATDISGQITNHHYVIDSKPLTDDEWANQYEDRMATAAGTSESTH